MRRLTPEELAEADKLGKATADATRQLDIARAQMDGALLAGVDQGSDRWGKLCDGMENAIRRRDRTQTAENDWWRSKGFTF